MNREASHHHRHHHPSAKVTTASSPGGYFLVMENLTTSNTVDDVVIYTSTQRLEIVEVIGDKEDVTDLFGWVVGCVGFVAAVFAVATLQWYRKKKYLPKHKKKAKQKWERTQLASERRIIDGIRADPIRREHFVPAYTRKISNCTLPCELKAIEKITEKFAVSVGSLDENRHRNASQHYIPYDDNRVKLSGEKQSDDDASDYINASYIYKYENTTGGASGQTSPRKVYIATQNILENTVLDFWRMVWEQDTKCIVMLTDIYTYSEQECEKYWHDTYKLYGDIHVRLEETKKTRCFSIRTFRISKDGDVETRVLTQLQFHGWVKDRVPDCSGLLEFRRRFHSIISDTCSIPIIHCRDGSERTGAFITVDFVLDTLEKSNKVDILRTILSLRKSRAGMVSQPILLRTVYDAIFTYITCGNSVVSTRKLNKYVSNLRVKHAGLSQLDREYALFEKMVPKLKVTECAAGHRQENWKKSRDIMMQPPERARPHLMTFDMNEHSDFINAVYVDGFENANQYIIGEWPVKASIHDFWRLMFDKKISSTVVLHPPQGNPSNYPDFWPNELGTMERYGPVAVRLVDSRETPRISVKTFVVRKYLVFPSKYNVCGPRYCVTTQLVFMKNWPDNHIVPDRWEYCLELMSVSNQWKIHEKEEDYPTFVMSKNGVSRVGLYCALANCIEQIALFKEVDVFGIVKNVMKNRPALVTKLEYYFLYTMIHGLVHKDAIRSKLSASSRLIAASSKVGSLVLATDEESSVNKKSSNITERDESGTSHPSESSVVSPVELSVEASPTEASSDHPDKIKSLGTDKAEACNPQLTTSFIVNMSGSEANTLERGGTTQADCIL